MERMLARTKSSSSLNRKMPGSGSASSVTPSDQKPREEKTAQYRDQRYKTLLATKGSFMDESALGITDESKDIISLLLSSQQITPMDSLSRDDLFKTTCRKVEDKDEARVIRDITPLIVPSAENLTTYGASELNCLIESTNEGWNNSVPLTGIRPQPDYSVGFRREAFTNDQLEKLSPFIDDFLTGDQSFFVATYMMYFPFLTCEVKCGTAALDIADRENAHSTTLAVRGIVELFRLVKRETELHRQILTFSVPHDHCSVRIYGHHPIIDGKDTEYYRYPIHKFDFTAMGGRDKWTAYRFMTNVYKVWMPAHFKKICSALDKLPSHIDFNVPSLLETGLSQDHISHSDVGSLPASEEPHCQFKLMPLMPRMSPRLRQLLSQGQRREQGEKQTAPDNRGCIEARITSKGAGDHDPRNAARHACPSQVKVEMCPGPGPGRWRRQERRPAVVPNFDSCNSILQDLGYSLVCQRARFLVR